MPPLPVVSNTSPIINLVGVDLLHVLHDLYGEIWIPDEVLIEFSYKSYPKSPDLRQIPWIITQNTSYQVSLTMPKRLGAGEVAAITLAQVCHARLLIIDDHLGRKVAQEKEIPITGTVGILLEAKIAGLVPAIRPIIDEMIAQGRYISLSLRQMVLEAAGE
jgi:predicted nucleic acid-binding protein